MSDDISDVTRRAAALLAQIAYGPAELIKAALQPLPDDYAGVFVGDMARRAEEFYAGMWADPPAALVKSVGPQIRVFVSRSEDIAESREFPGGYRKIAPHLMPGQLWVRFKLVGGGGADVIGYDGLVARGERWAWFPKPWRMLESDESRGAMEN